MRYLTTYKLFEYLKYFDINDNQYWFEVRDPKDEKGYSVGWGVGNIEDDDISKFNRTDRHEQFKIFGEVKKLFTEWFNNNHPDKFYFSVPGEKRMNIYINFLEDILENEYEYEIQKTDYKPFDLKEQNVYYVLFKKKPINESNEEIDYYNGLTKEDIEDMFIDVSDMGFQVDVLLDKRIVMVDKDWKIGNTRTTFGQIPLITIRISLPIKSTPGNYPSYQEVDSMKKENEDKLRKLKVSGEFNSIIDEVNDRVSSNEWYVFDTSLIGNGYGQYTLKVFLQRKSDSKYDK